jgi:hypothetical protein
MKKVSSRYGLLLGKMTPKIVLISAFTLLFVSLGAVRLKYKVTSLRLNVAEVDMELKDPYIRISARTRINLPLFPHMDNRYEILHDESFLPIQYKRIVHQGEIRDSVQTVYDGARAMEYRKSTANVSSYPIKEDSRDFFSFLAKICSDNNAGGTYYVDGNGRIWKATVSSKEIEKISTALGKQNARKHEIGFEPLSSQKAPYIDMLTFNFLDPETKLSLWISTNGIPLKAQIKKKRGGMQWEILSAEQ